VEHAGNGASRNGPGCGARPRGSLVGRGRHEALETARSGGIGEPARPRRQADAVNGARKRDGDAAGAADGGKAPKGRRHPGEAPQGAETG